MTNADLREKAEAAMPGPWEATDGVVWIDTREQVCCGRGYQECCGEPDVIGGQEKVADTNAPNAAYIAAANPSTVLELIADLTSAKAEIERLKEENGKLRIIASYIAGTNDDEIRVALAGNPIACDSLISRAAAAMGEEPRT